MLGESVKDLGGFDLDFDLVCAHNAKKYAERAFCPDKNTRKCTLRFGGCAIRVIVHESHIMTPDQIKEWLKATSRTRESLAEELGYSKRTVDNWFTAGDIPLPAIQHIRRIRAAEQQGQKLRFSLEEWDQIEAARKLAGYEDRGQFMVDALTSFAESIAKRATPDYLSIVPDDSSKAAEGDDDPPDDPPPPPARKPRKKR